MRQAAYALMIMLGLGLVLPAHTLAQWFGNRGPDGPPKTTFELFPNPKFLDCLAADPNEPPTAEVRVKHLGLNDQLTLVLHGVKRGLAFDLFTIENSNLKSDGTVDPSFKNFGLAWYQSDVEVNERGEGEVRIQTILLNEIFGFDPKVTLAPTHTFHLGIWFDDPEAAAPCGFDPTKPTPFNGNQMAGPNAMISVPNALTGLGPLCISPDTSVTPATCNP